MSRYIDADKYQKDLLSAYDDLSIELEVLDRQPLVSAIPITEGATNGDMVEKIFGKDVFYTLISMIYVSCCEKLKKWWDAPYKKENWINFAEELKDVFEERED